MLAAALILGCARDPGPGWREDAVRASVALRGVHPSPAELEALGEGRLGLREAARGWTRDPGFAEAIRDLHAEQLLVRVDTRAHLPPLGPLADELPGPLAESFDEEPLRLIERVVTEGRPYAEILTSPTTAVDRRLAAAWGLPFDPEGPAWQEAAWTDGRPAAGILATHAFLQRYQSTEQNRHRSRAARVLAALACTPLDGATLELRDPSPMQDAVSEDPACAACHVTLDPVAAAFSGARRYVLPSEVREAERSGCPPELADACYPISLWDEARTGDADRWGLPAPAWRGEPVGDLAGLGAAIAADPAFEACAARRFRSWFAQEPLAEVDGSRAAALAEALRSSGGDARELALAVVLDEDFLALPRLWVRPEQAGRLVEDLTGFRWDLGVEGWGPVEVGRTDEYGLRSLMGGLDGWNSVIPDPSPSPTRELAWRWLAQEAAAHAVSSGREPPGGPVTGEEEARAALADLHRRWLAEEASEEALDADLELLRSALARGGPERAWTLVLTAFLLDDRVVGY